LESGEQTTRSRDNNGILFAVFIMLMMFYFAASTSLRNRHWQDPLTIWHDVLSKSPWSVRPYNNLGNAYRVDYNKPREAIKYYDRAHELSPREVPPLHNMAVSYLMLRDFNGASIALEKAVQIDPSHAVLWGNLGYTYLMTNRITEAVDAFKTALVIDPNYKMARENLEWAQMAYGVK